MRYRSNLVAPDMRRQFRLLDPPRQMLGHDAPSDPDFDPNCTYWTDDEAAILYHVGKQITGVWVDIGARLGWTAAHLIEAGVADVWAVEPEYYLGPFLERMQRNARHVIPAPYKAAEFFRMTHGQGRTFDGFVIDGDHDDPQPTCDALGCMRVAKQDCVILLHDFRGQPIQDAVMVLLFEGFRCRIYETPNGVALCWRGYPDFVPPEHTPDPMIDWEAMRPRIIGFDWTKCE